MNNDTEKRTKTHACDLISRSAAIMGLIFSDGTSDLTCGQMAKVLYVIKALPSTQPEPEHTMEEFMYGQDLGSSEDGSL